MEQEKNNNAPEEVLDPRLNAIAYLQKEYATKGSEGLEAAFAESVAINIPSGDEARDVDQVRQRAADYLKRNFFGWRISDEGVAEIISKWEADGVLVLRTVELEVVQSMRMATSFLGLIEARVIHSGVAQKVEDPNTE